MAQTAPAEDIIGDMTRESLIAISYSLPESEPALPAEYPKKSPEVANGVIDKEDTSVEDFSRSKLISLSYTAPEDEPLPELNG